MVCAGAGAAPSSAARAARAIVGPAMSRIRTDFPIVGTYMRVRNAASRHIIRDRETTDDPSDRAAFGAREAGPRERKPAGRTGRGGDGSRAARTPSEAASREAQRATTALDRAAGRGRPANGSGRAYRRLALRRLAVRC